MEKNTSAVRPRYEAQIAHQTYTQRRAEVTAQIAALQAALTRLDADHAARPKDWRLVGDLGHVCGELQTVLDFIEDGE